MKIELFIALMCLALNACGEDSASSTGSAPDAPPAEASQPAETAADTGTPAEKPADTAPVPEFVPVTTPRLWEEATYDVTAFNCVKAMPASNPAVTEEWAISYCVCILDQASRRYSFAEYSAREASIAQELNADGTMPWCIERAGRDAAQ